MAITPLPDPPSRSDPANFPERADAFMAALPGFATEANALAQQVDEATETAGEYKDSAGASATAASGSETNALLSETHAQGSATAAAQARTDSQAARDLAKDWASKASGTVDGTPFLSAKQYAELAAAGAGVPIYSPIPTTDQGLIVAPDQGVMQWDATALRYYSVQPLHGQCRLVYTSATTITLIPYGGNGLVINGRQYWIPSSGVTLTNSSTGAGGQYYVYAQDDGSGGMSLGAVAVTAATHSANTDGVEIITGDPNKTLVGWACLNGVNNFLDSAAQRRVASWFNRRTRYVAESFTGATASQTAINVGSGASTFCWVGEQFYGSAMISVSNTNVATGMFFSLRKNAAPWAPTASGTAPGAQYGIMLPVVVADGIAQQSDERLITIQMYTSVNGGTESYTFYYAVGASI